MVCVTYNRATEQFVGHPIALCERAHPGHNRLHRYGCELNGVFDLMAPAIKYSICFFGTEKEIIVHL